MIHRSTWQFAITKPASDSMPICQLLLRLWLKMWPNENLLSNQEVVQTKMPKNKRGSAYNISSSTMQPIDQTPKLWEPPFHVSWHSRNVTLKCVRSRDRKANHSDCSHRCGPSFLFKIQMSQPIDSPGPLDYWIDGEIENIRWHMWSQLYFGSLGTVQLCSSCWAADGAHAWH
jgi:hypothetical protein